MPTRASNCDGPSAILAALHRSQAIIEFAMDGTILTANQNYLDALGFTLAEIEGRHHRMFLAPGEDSAPEYQAFWDRLRQGQFQSAEYRRITRDGREIWIQASYNPVIGPDGQPYKVVKLATDITASKLLTIEHTGKVEAIDKSQAVVEFAVDGTILDANAHFCRVFGYDVEEIRGRHHSMFVNPSEHANEEYNQFWAALRRGEYRQGEYRRIGKNGRDVWIQANYNPILDPFGRTLKIVKFATDTTQAKLRAADDQGKIEAISKSQAIIEFAMDGTILTANGKFLTAFGYELDDIVGRHHSLFVPVEEQDTEAYHAFWTDLRNGDYCVAEYRRIGKDGRTVWIQASYNPIFGLDGAPIKVVKFAVDITGEVARREQVRMLSLVADTTSNSVVITDADGRIEYVNAGFCRMTGYNFEEVRGRKPGNLLQGPATSEVTRERIRRKLEDRLPFCDEILNYTRGGDPYWITLFINPVKDEQGQINRFVSIQTDVTERKTIEAQIAFMAQHDALTGLANRVLFHDKLSKVQQRGGPFALMCLDLDGFKQVNDSFGHPAGDELLRKVAHRLVDCVRPTDIVARLGGDEFAVIYADINQEHNPEEAALRIIRRIAAPFEIGFQHVSIGVSIGIAVTVGSAIKPDLLLKQADQALYRAKGAGRGTYRLAEPTMDGRIVAEV
ncbi:sensor domain-containing protein [Lichenifustis flavocetrariae]|uniref:PAS domain S-box protein n=1 Tax=Lichenifustis flavocetrariae TaxID=2949735 RepID=A0AA41ZA16_9HYPH|nr:PAS domain S-box protein [Lichenifustis flavocetrariae]MCW6513045.1 PAS domain S-box protein [Lichenifustis flavocetrariae]